MKEALKKLGISVVLSCGDSCCEVEIDAPNAQTKLTYKTAAFIHQEVTGSS